MVIYKVIQNLRKIKFWIGHSYAEEGLKTEVGFNLKKIIMFLRSFKLGNAFMVSLALLFLISCGSDDEKSIVEIAQSDTGLTQLVSALGEAGLVTTLSGEGPFTVFAPTDAAFQDLLDSNNDWNSVEDIPDAVLESVLLFHVLSGEVKAEDLSDTYVSTLSDGPGGNKLSLQVDVTGGVAFNGDASPITTDTDASNGVIHKIDKVMLPPSVVNIALNNANFSILVDALTDSRHTTDFVSVLSGSGPFTVFAPTNDAFVALLDSNPAWNSLADVPIATLDAVLQYHVLAGANVQSSELTDGQTVTMLNGNNIIIDLSNGAKITSGSGQSVNIAITDVQGSNGVVHAIDQVLLP